MQPETKVDNIEEIASPSSDPPLRIVPPTSKVKRTPIKASVGIHDRTQVEVVFAYFPNNSTNPNEAAQSYQVDAYLFTPLTMGITKSSYPKDRFYSDLRPLLRLREPKLSYKELQGAVESDEGSPIKFLRRHFDGIRAGTVASSPELATDEVHLFSCSYLSYCYRKLKRVTNKIKKILKSDLDPATLKQLREKVAEGLSLIEKSHHILREWRRLRSEVASSGPDFCPAVRAEMSLADEYCSYAFRDGMALFLMILPDLSEVMTGGEVRGLQRRVKIFLRFERWYARNQKFRWMEPDGSQDLMEAYVTRRSSLKKHMQQVLYLDLRTRPMFAFQQQLGGMLAAAVAAMWAAVADVVIRSRSSGGGHSSALGMSGFVFMTALIIAYVLKDRIKELGKSYFSGKFLARIPDNSCNIEYHNSSGADIDIGEINEYTRFVSPTGIPRSISRLRAKMLDVDNAASYNIIHYKKRINLDPTALSKLLHPVKAVHDILRLNIQSFLIRLDDVLHEEFAFHPSGEVVSVMMPKVYYLDLILRYSWGKDERFPRERSFEFIRLVLNKNGLTRVDRVMDCYGAVADMAD